MASPRLSLRGRRRIASRGAVSAQGRANEIAAVFAPLSRPEQRNDAPWDSGVTGLWKRSHTFVAEDLSVLSETDAPNADLSGTVPDMSRRIRNADEPCRRRDGGDGRRHGCTAASSTANYGPGAPGSFGGRRRLPLDAWRTHAATGVDGRTRGAASRCRAAFRASTGTVRSPRRVTSSGRASWR